MSVLKRLLRELRVRAPYRVHRRRSPADEFHSDEFWRITQRRQEHLASLGLPIEGRSVFEVGAGIGDHTTFFIDRGCSVVTSDGRPANVEILRQRFPGLTVLTVDLDATDAAPVVEAEVVYCYGTLYHLAHPLEALAYLRRCCTGMLLLETCVSAGVGRALNPIAERSALASQALSGRGCRPTRGWVIDELRALFPYAYVSVTQPWHEQFPLDWNHLRLSRGQLTRCIFVASVEPTVSPFLSPKIVDVHRRH